MASVQFYGKEAVLQSYRNCEIPAWGLFSGKQLLCRYNGNDMDEGYQLLDEFISRIEGSSATYTLKVFELKPGEKVKEKSECDSSFNFKIDELGTFEERQQHFIGRNKSIIGTLEQLQKDIQELKNPQPEEEEEEEQPLIAKIGSVIEESLIEFVRNPGSDNIISTLLRTITGNNNPAPSYNPAAIGNIPQSQQTINTMQTTAQQKTEQEQLADLQRLEKVINVLETADPDYINHLEKIAKIAQEKPKKFQSLLTMLDLMF